MAGKIKSVAVYCGHQLGNNPEYARAARRVGEILARNKITLVFGGGDVGLMGTVADAAIENGLLNGTYQKVLQGHRWDVETAKRALSDIFRNVMGVAGCCGSSPDHVLQTNIEKLKARYPDGFSADRSLHRADGDV